MQPPILPPEEALRLRALEDTGLLDTPPKERFDRLTRLAKQALGVPIALITLVDAERQWFKSRQGMEACETSREISFCGHAILSDGLFEVEDALSDPRFADNPLVIGPPHIRFYAGVPLATSDGYRIGTLCVIGDKPRRLTAKERSILRDLAGCVEAEISSVANKQDSLELVNAKALGDIIARAQYLFIKDKNLNSPFEALLHYMLDITGSEYGFIGSVLRDEDGRPYTKVHVFTSIASCKEAIAFFEQHAHEGLEFTNLDTLFGAAITTGKPVIANDPGHDPRRGGIPDGHPPLNAFLGVPVYHGGEMVAMYGLANRPGGYKKTIVDYLQSMSGLIGQLVYESRLLAEKAQTQAENERLARVASETINGVIITDVDGRVQWINRGFSRITGYSLEEMLGRKPGDVLQGPATDPACVAQMRSAIARREGFVVEVMNYTKDATPYWIAITCTPMFKGQALQGFMAVETDITEKKQTEIKLNQLKYTLDNALDCVFMFDAETLRFFYVNEGALRQVGYSHSELLALHAYDIKPDFTRERFCEIIAPLLSGEVSSTVFETVHQHKNGSLVPVEVFLQYINEPGEPGHFLSIVRDIEERKRAELAIKDQAQFTQAIIDNMADGMITIDARGVIQTLNLATESMFGFAASELVGKNISTLMPSPHRDQHDDYLRNSRHNGESRIIGVDRKLMGLRKNGEIFPIELCVSGITHNDEVHYVGLVTDITERVQREQNLRHMAMHDALTGLPNRTLFMDRLGLEVARVKREGGLAAVLLIDLDNFKLINDSFGHQCGDAFLVSLAVRLNDAIRDSDTIARLGGDEFGVILVGIESAAQVWSAAERLLKALHAPVLINGQGVSANASIGFCLCPENGDDPSTLLRYADVAMYSAKESGRGKVTAFKPDMDGASQESLKILARLKRAIDERGFELHYQPQVDTVSGRIMGAEALIRWNDAELGPVAPDRFIGLAELSGLILPLGEWVLNSACQQIGAWYAAGVMVKVAINVSPQQLMQGDLLEKILSACARHGCPAHLLQIEITESSVMKAPQLTDPLLAALVQAGFTLALDDFGTGHSSLARLSRLNVATLKIDCSFIDNMMDSSMNEALVRTIIRLGNEMGMHLVAEGVETEQQRMLLAKLGCESFQGWLFSKALPPENFIELFKRSEGAGAIDLNP